MALTHLNPGEEKFFFIRYNDPHRHMRIRVPSRAFEKIGMAALEKIILSGLGSDVMIRGFFPEYRRYGGRELWGENLEIFCAQSSLVSEVIGSTQEQDPTHGEELTVALMHEILRNLEDHSIQRLTARAIACDCDKSSDAYSSEDLSCKGFDSYFMNRSTPLIQKREAFRQALARLMEAMSNTPEIDVVDVVWTHLHMTANRSLFNWSRELEKALIWKALGPFEERKASMQSSTHE